MSKAKKYCGKWRWLNKNTGELSVFSCDSWECERCGPIKAKKLSMLIAKEAIRNEFKSLITLTLPAKYHNKSFKDGDKALKKGFERLSRKWRSDNKLLEYIWVEERHKSGSPHLHVLTNIVYSNHALHDMAHASGLGYMADITPILDDGGYFYVAKYLGKGERQIPKGVRRVGSSKGINIKHKYSSEDELTLFVTNPLP